MEEQNREGKSSPPTTTNSPTSASCAAAEADSSSPSEEKRTLDDARDQGCRQKVRPEVVAEIRRLFLVEKWKVHTITCALGIHRYTVHRAIGRAVPHRGVVRKRKTQELDEHREFIERTLAEYPRLRATRLADMLRVRGTTVSETTLRRYLGRHNLRPQPRRHCFLRTNPLKGEQAQVDWAQTGELMVPGGKRKLWLFVMTLSWSRASWGEFVFDLTADSLQRSLSRAAYYFGGNTRQWLFDNPRTIVTARHGEAIQFHPLLVETASHFLVQPRLCNPYSPQEKGRVERTIRYWRDRFLGGRHIRSIETGNEELLEFIDNIANARPHPTLPGRTVGDCLAEEREALTPLPSAERCTDTVRPVHVDKTAFIRFDTNSYSVPPDHVGEVVNVVATDTEVRIVRDDTIISTHRRCWGKRHVVENPKHREEILKRKKSGCDLKGRDRLRFHIENIDTLYERWVNVGRSLGSMTTRTGKLLDLYGPDILREAIGRVLQEDTHDPAHIQIYCEELRRQKRVPMPTELKLGSHVPDRDVIPHTLGDYDDV